MNLIGAPRNLRPRYNIAPSQEVAVVRDGDGGRSLSMLRWGLIPGCGLCGVPHNAQPGIRPQRSIERRRPVSSERTAATSWLGAMLYRGRRLRDGPIKPK